jgi:hypothetical protein
MARQARLQDDACRQELQSEANETPKYPAENTGADGLGLRRLLESRTPDGSLISIRIPVTDANRGLLRALRAEELLAWEAMGA